MIKYLKDCTENFGGKAIGLSKLINIGANVPNGIAITYDSIEKILSGDNELIENLNRYLNSIDSELFAVRSSAKDEDGKENSYAGIFDTILNVPNDTTSILDAIKTVYDSKNTSKVKEYSNTKQSLNVVIQAMITPIVSGVVFTKAMNTDGTDCLYIECIDDYGEKLVSGQTKATQITLSLNENNLANIEDLKIYGKSQILKYLIDFVQDINVIIKEFNTPMDIEWCIDNKGNIYFLQARPITQPVIVNILSNTGLIASVGKCTGKVCIINDDYNNDKLKTLIENFKTGDILVTNVTDTRYISAMKKASGIITQEGSLLSHASVIARELNIPCIIGFSNALNILHNGETITLDATNGTIITKDKTYIANKENSFNYAELFDFSEIAEITMENFPIPILYQPIYNGVCIILPDNTPSVYLSSIEMFSRKLFGTSPKYCMNSKYAWYWELPRFSKFSHFNLLDNLFKKCANQLDYSMATELYQISLDFLKSLMQYSNSCSKYDSLVISEIGLSFHFLLDMIFPLGYALKQCYLKSLPDLNGHNFNELITNQIEMNDNLQQVLKFFNTVGDLRQEVSTNLSNIGALKYDYFSNRIDLMQSFIHIEKTGVNIIEDTFYKNLKNSTDISNCLYEFCSYLKRYL